MASEDPRSSDSIKEHILSSHKSVPSPHVIHLLSKLPLQKKDFDYVHPPYDPKFTNYYLGWRMYPHCQQIFLDCEDCYKSSTQGS